MRNFKGKKGLGDILESKPVLAFLSILVLVSAWSLIGFWGRMEETKKNRKISEEKFSELEKAKTKLEADIVKLESERGIEEVLREDFGLAREGEGMIIVVEDLNPVDGEEGKNKSGFFNFLRNLFR
ncbi:MAG: septum formation initiator family protein [Patescibacteria group bacterium]